MKARFTALRTAAGAVALLTALAACGSGTTDSGGGGGGDKGSGPKVRLAVGIDASYAPFFIADSEGYFKKQGLNVEVVQFGRGGEAVDALGTGQVQLAGSSDTTTIGQLQQNPNLRSLLVYEQSGKYLKVVVGKNISDPKQIKKMAIVPGLSELAATRFLESKKIDTKSVKFITADPPEIPALLEKGDVDGYVLWEPWPAKGVGLGGRVQETTGDYGLTYVHWLIGDNKWLGGNQETAAKVARALDEGAKKTEADPQLAADVTMKAAKIPKDQTINAVKEIDFQVRDNAAADLKGYEATAKWFLDTGKAKSQLDVKAAVLLNWFGQHAKG